MKIPAKLLDRLLGTHAAIGRYMERQWTTHPFGRQPHAPREYYEEQFEMSKSEGDEAAEGIEQETGYALDRSIVEEFAKYTQIVKKSSRLNYAHGRMLYSFLRAHIQKAKLTRVNVIETGTARGFSALCMAQAIHDSNVDGTIISIDLTSHFNRQIWNCLDDHDGPKSRAEILSRWPHLSGKIIFLQGSSSLLLDRIGVSNVNFSFLDAQHTERAVLQEFRIIEKLQNVGDLIMFDDVTPSLFPGVCKAVDRIERTNRYSIQRINSTGERGYAMAERIS